MLPPPSPLTAPSCFSHVFLNLNSILLNIINHTRRHGKFINHRLNWKAVGDHKDCVYTNVRDALLFMAAFVLYLFAGCLYFMTDVSLTVCYY